jgi:hypothetical protein
LQNFFWVKMPELQHEEMRKIRSRQGLQVLAQRPYIYLIYKNNLLMQEADCCMQRGLANMPKAFLLCVVNPC